MICNIIEHYLMIIKLFFCILHTCFFQMVDNSDCCGPMIVHLHQAWVKTQAFFYYLTLFNIIQHYLKVLLQASSVAFLIFIIICRYLKLLNIIWILLPILLPTFEREYNLWKCWNKLNREVLLFVDI